MQHTERFLDEAVCVCEDINYASIELLAYELSNLKGRLFILGIGGSAGNASHAVNDFRKLCNIEAYAPTDNVSELTARANDDGFYSIFTGWLRASRLTDRDALLIFSVGGGNVEKNVSVNLIDAMKMAKEIGAKSYAIVGKNDGYAYKHADIAILIPVAEGKWVTPISEAFQAVIWHCLVSHPLLQKSATKW